MVRGGAIELVLEHAPNAGIDVGAIVGYVPKVSTIAERLPVPLAAASRGNSTFYEDADADDAGDAIPTSSATTISSSSRAPGSPSKKKPKGGERFRPARLRKDPACPACTCRKVPVEQENANRKLSGEPRLTVRAAQCTPDCEQRKWLDEQKATFTAAAPSSHRLLADFSFFLSRLSSFADISDLFCLTFFLCLTFL